MTHSPADKRKARLAEALRENLRRRKVAARAVAAETEGDATPGEPKTS